eukprot:gnl/Dysnectes_brevis/3541_a4500_1053.p1 GENE.gnl/Dysnectes_brevis/3541_a4500_1053~~gnl/Dysnectes_brevis/3541_a4500_1053.p1  ORF type:complete len:745 (-),score=209.27 gnl/Dysnectes_brevis/3541_a4500_1053:56-2290(-)
MGSKPSTLLQTPTFEEFRFPLPNVKFSGPDISDPEYPGPSATWSDYYHHCSSSAATNAAQAFSKFHKGTLVHWRGWIVGTNKDSNTLALVLNPTQHKLKGELGLQNTDLLLRMPSAFKVSEVSIPSCTGVSFICELTQSKPSKAIHFADYVHVKGFYPVNEPSDDLKTRLDTLRPRFTSIGAAKSAISNTSWIDYLLMCSNSAVNLPTLLFEHRMKGRPIAFSGKPKAKPSRKEIKLIMNPSENTQGFFAAHDVTGQLALGVKLSSTVKSASHVTVFGRFVHRREEGGKTPKKDVLVEVSNAQPCDEASCEPTPKSAFYFAGDSGPQKLFDRLSEQSRCESELLTKARSSPPPAAKRRFAPIAGPVAASPEVPAVPKKVAPSLLSATKKSKKSMSLGSDTPPPTSAPPPIIAAKPKKKGLGMDLMAGGKSKKASKPLLLASPKTKVAPPPPLPDREKEPSSEPLLVFPDSNPSTQLIEEPSPKIQETSSKKASLDGLKPPSKKKLAPIPTDTTAPVEVKQEAPVPVVESTPTPAPAPAPEVVAAPPPKEPSPLLATKPKPSLSKPRPLTSKKKTVAPLIPASSAPAPASQPPRRPAFLGDPEQRHPLRSAPNVRGVTDPVRLASLLMEEAPASTGTGFGPGHCVEYPAWGDVMEDETLSKFSHLEADGLVQKILDADILDLSSAFNTSPSPDKAGRDGGSGASPLPWDVVEQYGAEDSGDGWGLDQTDLRGQGGSGLGGGWGEW